MTITIAPEKGTREARVYEFLQKAQWPNFELVWNCLAEECLELKEAAQALYEDRTDEARKNFVKELADVQYVLSQVAVFYSVDLERAFTIVADNNMTKVSGDKVLYREDGKILKPEGYQKPDMSGL